jgi:hypothetical protein
MDKIISMLNSALKDLHAAGLPKNALQTPDDTPLNNAYQKITGAIISLEMQKLFPPK